MTPEQAHHHGFELVQTHTERFTAFVGDLDAGTLSARVPGGAWTVGQTITHVASVFLRYTVDRRRVDDRAELAARNDEDVSGMPDVSSAIESIHAQVDLLATVVPSLDPRQLHPFHGGQVLTAAGGWGNLLGELLAHGDDIARATGSTFGIPSSDLEILWRCTGHVLQGWLRPEACVHRDRWRLRFPFGPIDLTFERGQLGWAGDVANGGPPDHELAVDDAAEFTLTFPYRRRAVNDPTTALLAARFYDL